MSIKSVVDQHEKILISGCQGRQLKYSLQWIDNCAHLKGHAEQSERSHLGQKIKKKRTFLTTLGNVPFWNPMRVFHSGPTGCSSDRSNWALLV